MILGLCLTHYSSGSLSARVPRLKGLVLLVIPRLTSRCVCYKGAHPPHWPDPVHNSFSSLLHVDYSTAKADNSLVPRIIEPNRRKGPPSRVDLSRAVFFVVMMAHQFTIDRAHLSSRTWTGATRGPYSRRAPLRLAGASHIWVLRFSTPKRKLKGLRTASDRTEGYWTSIPNFLSFSKYFWTLLATCRGVRRPFIACEIFAHLRTIYSPEWIQKCGYEWD